MKTADINMSEQSAAEQNNPVPDALRSASPQESMMGKSVCLHSSHWMLLKEETLLSCVKMNTRNSELVAEYIPGISCTTCSQFIQVHLTEYLHSMAKECCPLWLFEWFSLKAEVVETTLYTVNHNNVNYATDKINIPQSWALFLVDLLLFSLCE